MELQDLVLRCEEILGYRFVNEPLLREAFTHASIADDRRHSNERLEFLGDSVLGLVICHRLYELFPDYLEGDLTKLKSAVVSRNTCAAISNSLGLTELIFVGKGMTARAERPSSLAAGVLESIIAAIYIDGGLTPARDFISRVAEPYIAQYAATTHQQNYKSLLQQHVQRVLNATPQYELLDETGPDHSKNFEVRVVVGSKVFGSAWGAAKKVAEQRAAQIALEEMGVLAREEPLPSETTEGARAESPIGDSGAALESDESDMPLQADNVGAGPDDTADSGAGGDRDSGEDGAPGDVPRPRLAQD